MKKRMVSGVIVTMLLVSGLISGCGDTTGGSPELPTPENLYLNDSAIDMFVYEDTAFVNAEDVDWVTEQDLTAGELAGTIEETDADGDFEDWDATVLPEGTKIYETDDAQIMLAECEGEYAMISSEEIESEQRGQIAWIR